MLNFDTAPERLNDSRNLLFQKVVDMGHAGCTICTRRIDSDFHPEFGWAGLLSSYGMQRVTGYEGTTKIELPKISEELIERFSELVKLHEPSKG